MDLAQKQRFIRIDCPPAERLNAGAWVGFEALGARAESAVPALMELFNRRITWWSQLYAVKSLGCMGPAAKTATPVLLAATTNSHFIVRAESLAALVHIHADPEVATTALIKGLSDPTSTVRHVACVFLEQIGEDARQAVPALVTSLKDPNSDVRYFAARALKAVDVEAVARAGVE